MSANKLLQAAAGAAGGESVYVEDVFSTQLYEGTGSAKTITTDIDMSGEGGMVWFKSRSSATWNFINDTERGATKSISTNSTNAENTYSQHVTQFNSNGYNIGTDNDINLSGGDFVNWSFRKQAGFFDVVTYSNAGTGNTKTVSHNLGAVPAVIIIKDINDSNEGWVVYHTSLGTGKFLNLNSTSAAVNVSMVQSVSSTNFVLQSDRSGVNHGGSANSHSYVAYLFAHDDQSFGDNSDESIIKCGSYTGNKVSGQAVVPNAINVGFEPQWILLKETSGAGSWAILDVMRGFSLSDDGLLKPNTTDFESFSNNIAEPTATGFTLTGPNWNDNGENYIYIAIRRPMKTPEAGTEVFTPNAYTGNGATRVLTSSNDPVDLGIVRVRGSTGDWIWSDRLRGATKTLYSNYTQSEATESTYITGFDVQDGMEVGTGTPVNGSGSTYISYMLSRATGFFDMVAYTGNGTAGTTHSHNLGVVPEFMIVKSRSLSEHWPTYHVGMNGGATPQNYNMVLSATTAEGADSDIWNNTAPTSSVFTVGGNDKVNRSGAYYIAYLFATLDGVSKVGSYTGTGSALTVDCGFSSGARFIMIKRTDAAAGWFVFDSARGIVAGADPYLYLNNNDAESSTDAIDPDSSGFIVNPVGGGLNTSGGTYIFLAIA